MKAVVIAMLLLTAGVVAVAAAPTASACAVNEPGDAIDCAQYTGNLVIDRVQCALNLGGDC